MKLPIYQVDAFTDRIFAGNPAAVMPLEKWLSDELLQHLAMENNLSETAYFVSRDEGYELRWFAPAVEISLCGHATLASAHILFENLDHQTDEILFYTRSGELKVRRSEHGLTLDFPATEMTQAPVEGLVCEALGAVAIAAAIQVADPWMVIYEFASEQQVRELEPDFRALLASSEYAIVATAAAEQGDFVSRFFGPQLGIDEDPVTGSAHCCLTPYWAQKLGRTKLKARQISARGGNLACELGDGRVFMTGTAVTFMKGTVEIPGTV
ncbi:MAG: PhzF family phenazine biosynthesis protein [Halieaceae bacterium]|jgi:PhzF family phenazine biosynthesis protein